jgi:hypothetical protein
MHKFLQVDQFGVHISGKGSWGHCSQECPVADTDDYEEDEIIRCRLSNGGTGTCQPFGICAGFVLDQSAGFVFDQDGQPVEDECNEGEGLSIIFNHLQKQSLIIQPVKMFLTRIL